ncbi:SpoIID/LytB domain-containing protein [Leptothermofonsia sp. ETS-13]|uniref:SpoIID/LytB domain-containing protein n=1 Tax=Leptothermofonsia sp. ETS-13 TaxID=3035696 RepID=UPI003BA26562
MTEPQFPSLIKRYLWVVLPLLGGLSLGAIVLNQPQKQAASSQNEIAVASPLPKVPVAVTPSPSPLAKPSPRARKSLPAKVPPKPVNPATYTEQEKAINQEAKLKFLASAATVDSLIEIRVAIAEGIPSTTIGASSDAILMDKDGRRLQQLSPGTSYPVQPNGDSIRLGSWQLPSIVILDPGIGQVFQLGDRIYRGRLLLVSDQGNLWGINYVNLRQYLHSVVGSEVSPSWPMEALKAQAVAARSYALTYYFKPAHSLYNLGATEYYQVYTGIEREADPTRKAVDNTAGEFVSYRGGIVESLYAASDDIVAEAFRGHGMSQLGALDLAEKGYNYKQILSNYYPGTGVGRVEEDYN